MLEVRGLTSSYDATRVLRGVDLRVERGEIVCLLGPSGCGKTTFLRIVAGLEAADSGDIMVEGEPMNGVPVHVRDFGLMFQEFALFPHMTVAENVMFGLRMRKMPKVKRVGRMREVLELVGLAGFEDRDVAQLSGGERQRVALARSLAPKPRLLMLDEPLGSLDARLRSRLVIELRHIIKSIGLTTVYVTHDQQESFAIADRVAVMNDGQIEQFDLPLTLYRHPKTIFTAQFLRLNNIVPVDAYRNGQAETRIGTFDLPEADAVLIHPDDLELAEDGQLTGTVEECVFQGNHYQLAVEVQGVTFSLKVLGNAVPEAGQQVRLRYDPAAVLPLTAGAASHPPGMSSAL